MQQHIMYVNLVDVSKSSEKIEDLPVIQIILEGMSEHRTIGLEQIATTVLALATFPKDQSDYIPFRLEIWDSREPDCPELIEVRRRRRTTTRQEGGAL